MNCPLIVPAPVEAFKVFRNKDAQTSCQQINCHIKQEGGLKPGGEVTGIYVTR